MSNTNSPASCHDVLVKAAGYFISLSIIGGSAVILSDALKKNNAGKSDSAEQALVILAACGYMASHSYNFGVGMAQLKNEERFKPSPFSQQVVNGVLALSSVFFFCNNLRNWTKDPATPPAAGLASLTVPICFFSASGFKAGLIHTKGKSAYGLNSNTAKKMVAGSITAGGGIFLALNAYNGNIPLIASCGVLAVSGIALGGALHQAEKAKPKIHPLDNNTHHPSPRGDEGLSIA